jgi:hypothetical protein
MVNAAANEQPTSMPLVENAVASQMRYGAQSRTSVGSAGWKMATPKPISMVAA